jgi:hypothetical protein
VPSRFHLNLKRTFLSLILILSSAALAGCAESAFDLAPASRLPQWFNLPKGLTRAQVTVQDVEYLDHSEFGLYDLTRAKSWGWGMLLDYHEGYKIAQVTVDSRHIVRKRFTSYYPFYEAVTVNRITEVLEFKRMEPIFYVTDDPEIRAAMGLPGV